MPSTALSGIRVLDLSRVLAGPLAAQLLGDLGAEVIKVERPGAGDDARRYGPPFLTDRAGGPTDTAAFYLSCNRNKQSITVDLSTADGQELIRRLAARCDVLIENFRTGTPARYGLDYAALREVNPGLVYVSITGFGQTGPYADRPGYDGVFQAMSGLMSVSGHADEPMKVGISIVDVLTSHYAATAVLAALRHRDQGDGRGQHIDLSLLDCGLASLSHYAMNYLVSGEVPRRRGNGGFGGVPSRSFDCADRPLFLVAGTDRQFQALCEAAGRTDLAADPRFADIPSRITHSTELHRVLEEIFLSKTREEWLTLLEEHGVPAGAVNDISEAVADPQLRHRGMIIEVEDPHAGKIPMPANPIRLSATPVDGYAPPPRLGEHTEQVLVGLAGLTAEQVGALRERGVV
jgi:crotonobetainyl-CoA:carnitine CoA-transferase CaiB-like acyl-CoA transferase